MVNGSTCDDILKRAAEQASNGEPGAGGTSVLTCLLKILSDLEGGGLDPDGKEAAKEILEGAIPSAENVKDHLKATASGTVGISIIYTYGPIFVVAVLLIWILVPLGWISWVGALVLTVVVLIILYILTLAYRITLETYLTSQIEQLETEIGDYLGLVFEDIAVALIAAMNAYCDAADSG